MGIYSSNLKYSSECVAEPIKSQNILSDNIFDKIDKIKNEEEKHLNNQYISEIFIIVKDDHPIGFFTDLETANKYIAEQINLQRNKFLISNKKSFV